MGGDLMSADSRVSRGTERAFPHPAVTTAADDCRSAVRLGYVPRTSVRQFSCQLHNGIVGLCSPVLLLPPSFLSGGPAQNVGPSVARIPRVSLAYTRTLSVFLSPRALFVRLSEVEENRGRRQKVSRPRIR